MVNGPNNYRYNLINKTKVPQTMKCFKCKPRSEWARGSEKQVRWSFFTSILATTKLGEKKKNSTNHFH